MLFNRNIHIVSHTHWDREWYFSTCDSLVLLDQSISDILDELNQNKRVNFCLDGQVSILDDYLKLYPEKLENIQSLVKQKRLFIGPWYTQTDTQLVSGQSIVGNLYYGIYRSLHLVKDYMKIGYLPDTFGFSNQMPMIMKQFELDNFIFWRGSNFKKQNIEPYFKWIAQDGSEVSAAILHNGYGMAKGLNTSESFVEKKLKPLIEEYKELSEMNDILIPVGNDQNNIVKDLDKKIASISKDLHISTYEDFMKAIQSQIKKEYTGEFREVPYTRIHKSSGAIRNDIKQSNYQAEIALTKNLEPLNVMAHMEHMGVSNHLIQEAWKLLFEGQAHDGIIGCVSDSVASDILIRNKQALEIATSSQNLIKKQFAKRLNLKENELLLFNLEMTPFKGYKEIEIFTHTSSVEMEGVISQSIVKSKFFQGYSNALVETPEGNYYEEEKDYYLHKVLVEVELPSFGYQIFEYKEVEEVSKNKVKDSFISNEMYTIDSVDGKLSLYMDNQVIDDFISLHDCGNAGDTYDFSPIRGDEEIRIDIKDVTVVKHNNIETMTMDASVLLPRDEQARLQKKFDTKCDATLEVSLRKDDMILVKIIFDNQVLSHRLRLAIKGVEKAKQTLAATPFGSVRRDILNGNIPNDWSERYVEYPIDIDTNSGFVSMVGEGKQLSVFNKGLKEYQAQDESIYITLFSACDELGKPDLMYRPGRASGDTTKRGHIRMMTPLAQVQGLHTYELAVSFVENDDATLYKKLHTFEDTSVFYQTQNINLFYERIDNKIQLQESESLPNKKHSYLQLDGDLLVMGIYTSMFDGEYRLRVMSFEDVKKDEVQYTHAFKVSNLLEHGDEQEFKAYRLYTMKGSIK